MENMEAYQENLLPNCRDYCYMENCKITLFNKELWKEFDKHQNEMIITKVGRRMFPSLTAQVTNLDPHEQYCVFLEFNPATPCRYKYTNAGGWTPTGAQEAQSPQRMYLHPDSPATGEYWMSQKISFCKVKLTNTLAAPEGQIVLTSMHKYAPQIVVVKTSNPRTAAWAPSRSATFSETQFIAVTAYQNEKITKLKIDNNPFAKGFRENGQSKCKRKRNSDSCGEDPQADIEQGKAKIIRPWKEEQVPTPPPSKFKSEKFHLNSMLPAEKHMNSSQQRINYYKPLPLPVNWWSYYYYYQLPGQYSQYYAPVTENIPSTKILTDFSIEKILSR